MIWALGLISLKYVFGNPPSLDGSQEMWGTSAQEFNRSFKKLQLQEDQLDGQTWISGGRIPVLRL